MEGAPHCPLRVERTEGRGVVWVSDDGKLREVEPAFAEQAALPRKIVATLCDPLEELGKRRRKERNGRRASWLNPSIGVNFLGL